MNLDDFVGNPNAYAVQRKEGGYLPVREPLTRAVLDTHEAGGQTVGTYVVNFDKARFFVFDIDEHNLELGRKLAWAAAGHGFDPSIEFSGRKGFHVWVLLDQWYLAADVMRVAKAIAREVGFTGEVFPKQAVARDLGNLIKLPLGLHAVSGNPSTFLAVGLIAAPGVFDSVLAALPPDPVFTPASTGRPCMDSIQEDPPQPGSHERNNLFFQYATQMRRASLHAEAIRAALDELNDRGSCGMSDQELDSITERSEWVGPICAQLPEARQCGTLCINNKGGGLSVRPGQLRHATEGELVVVKVGPHGVGNLIELEHPDFDVARATLKPTDNKGGN